MIDSCDSRAARRRNFVARGGRAVTARVIGIEVTQAVQNLKHQVRLVAGKRAVVRVYLSPGDLARNVRVHGEIVVSRTPGGPGCYITSANQVSLRASGHPTLSEQRRDAELSLNFEVPAQAAGPLSITVNRLIPTARGDDMPLDKANLSKSVTYEPGVPLRVRAVGLRYTDYSADPQLQFSPDAVHFELLRSFLERAFPSAGVEWSQIVISADPDFGPPFSGPPLPDGSDPRWLRLLNISHAFMARLRQSEVNAGRDPRTHYYGVISDEADFFRGAANAVPTAADPSVVAVGPAGRPFGRFLWDHDLSYGDWYGAHELAHTFGCRHPGHCNDQGRDPLATFPYPDGKLSTTDEDCIGFDIGDKALGLPMRVYPHEEWHDIMTYCGNQWVSKHTYDSLYDRLLAEDERFAPVIAGQELGE